MKKLDDRSETVIGFLLIVLIILAVIYLIAPVVLEAAIDTGSAVGRNLPGATK